MKIPNQNKLRFIKVQKVIFFVFSVFLYAGTSAQDTLNFELSKLKGVGNYKILKIKSKITGMTTQLSLPNGIWEFYDSTETLKVVGKYKVSNGRSKEVGNWLFYDNDGELVMSINRGKKGQEIKYYKPAIIKTKEGLDIIKEGSSGGLEAFHYKDPKLSRQVWVKNIGLMEMNGDSFSRQNLDTLSAMDKRNPDRTLIPEMVSTLVAEELNLVRNGSFEINQNGDRDFTNIADYINYWAPSAGTPDYFYSNAYHAMDGKASVGCRFYTEQGLHLEFITTVLKKKLLKDSLYCFKAYFKLKEDSYYGVNAMGVYFDGIYSGEESLINGKIKPHIKHNGGAIMSYKTEWMLLSGVYKSRGEEALLTIGSFANADSMKKKRLKGALLEAYYYIDNVSLSLVSDSSKCPCTMGKKVKPVKKERLVFVIKNVFFDNDKWDLLPASNKALDSLYQVILDNAFYKIEISGHTSNTGSRERNQFLSKKRAEAVKNYLVSKGLEEELFVCKGYGPDFPIADNNTEIGRSENRRVEFEILSDPEE